MPVGLLVEISRSHRSGRHWVLGPSEGIERRVIARESAEIATGLSKVGHIRVRVVHGESRGVAVDALCRCRMVSGQVGDRSFRHVELGR